MIQNRVDKVFDTSGQDIFRISKSVNKQIFAEVENIGIHVRDESLFTFSFKFCTPKIS